MTAAGVDGISRFMGIRWDDQSTARLEIRSDLMNPGGLLSGVATYALVDYTMATTLLAETNSEEAIATITIAINYVQTATEGEVTCRVTLDRRNRTNAVMRAEVSHADGRLLAAAVGSYAIYRPRAA